MEDLWARRKVGYLLDQIRVNGEKKELVDEVVTLAKRYGITTPYTSYLVVPDGPLPWSGRSRAGKPPVSRWSRSRSKAPAAGPTEGGRLRQGRSGRRQTAQGQPRGCPRRQSDKHLSELADEAAKGDARSGSPRPQEAIEESREQDIALNQGRQGRLPAPRPRPRPGRRRSASICRCSRRNLRNQTSVTRTASKYVQNRNCIDVGGVWIDDGFNPKMPTVTVKAMSEAYFRILREASRGARGLPARQPSRLGHAQRHRPDHRSERRPRGDGRRRHRSPVRGRPRRSNVRRSTACGLALQQC